MRPALPAVYGAPLGQYSVPTPPTDWPKSFDGEDIRRIGELSPAEFWDTKNQAGPNCTRKD